MAHGKVVEYTAIIKRICLFIQAVEAATDDIAELYVQYGLAELISDPANLPTGFMQEDYEEALTVRQQMHAFVKNQASWAALFIDFFIFDPLDFLGKQGVKGWDYDDPYDPPTIVIPNLRVGIYTLAIKRIVHAIRNLRKALDEAIGFYVRHGIGAILDDPANLPDGFTREQYDHARDVILPAVENFYENHLTWGNKMYQFNGSTLQDLYPELGDRFWRKGSIDVIRLPA